MVEPWTLELWRSTATAAGWRFRPGASSDVLVAERGTSTRDGPEEELLRRLAAEAEREAIRARGVPAPREASANGAPEAPHETAALLAVADPAG